MSETGDRLEIEVRVRGPGGSVRYSEMRVIPATAFATMGGAAPARLIIEEILGKIDRKLGVRPVVDRSVTPLTDEQILCDARRGFEDFARATKIHGRMPT